MILLNFSHPLTAAHVDQIEALTGQKVERIMEVNSRIDPEQPLAPQVMALADQAGLSSVEWQTLPIAINPPSLNFVAVALLAELHGRMGYFPSILRFRQAQGSLPPSYEVAEILNLQELRDVARNRR